MYQPDIVIHIDEDLDDTRIHDLEKELCMRAGVVSACVHADRRHLMVVDYDAKDIAAGDILHQVRANGLHAELIGL